MRCTLYTKHIVLNVTVSQMHMHLKHVSIRLQQYYTFVAFAVTM